MVDRCFLILEREEQWICVTQWRKWERQNADWNTSFKPWAWKTMASYLAIPCYAGDDRGGEFKE